jgi:hypothetical protein
MISVNQAMYDTTVPAHVREILHLIPMAKRAGLQYCGSYICPQSGTKAAILKSNKYFIVCRFGSTLRCSESPSIFSALEGVGVCECLWKE